MDETLRIDIGPETESNKKEARSKADRFNQKITTLENILLVSNFVLELPSAVFDQLSSVHKPQFALLSMLLSFTVFLISVAGLVYKGRQERVCLIKKGLRIPWFYNCSNSKPFGTFADIIGLVCAFFQCIFSSVAFACLSRNTDNPVKVSTWPLFFAIGQLCTKLSGNLLQRKSCCLNPTTKRDRSEEEFTLGELAVATCDFTDEYKLGDGRYGVVYKGQLLDGREVAIQRKLYIGDDQQKNIEEDLEESVYESELVNLLRVHRKHLVGLVGYCEQGTERLLVFELEAQLDVSEERDVPSFFLCPMLQEIMHDPQVAADGYMYEGEALRRWFETGHETSPMTNLKLSHLNLTPNHALRHTIQEWLSKS